MKEVNYKELRAEAAGLKAAGYDFLVDMVGTDDGEALGAIYYLAKGNDTADVVAIKTTAAGDREHPTLPSVHDIWEVGQLYEREVHDYFGIVFEGNPDMRRLFLRETWKGYPLRKDYDADPTLNPQLYAKK